VLWIKFGSAHPKHENVAKRIEKEKNGLTAQDLKSSQHTPLKFNPIMRYYYL
jgi:hypothetical protein